MTNDVPIGIDPVDFPSLDNSDIYWDKDNEQWVVVGKGTAYCHLHSPSTNKQLTTKRLLWDTPDDISGSDTVEKYNNYDAYKHHFAEFTAYLYVLGYSKEQFPGLTIDDIIKKVRNVYKYKHGEPVDLASQVYIKRKNIAMVRGIRRSNYGMQVTKNGR